MQTDLVFFCTINLIGKSENTLFNLFLLVIQRKKIALESATLKLPYAHDPFPFIAIQLTTHGGIKSSAVIGCKFCNLFRTNEKIKDFVMCWDSILA